MGDGYGKLFLLLLAIGLIFLAASGKGKAVWAALTAKSGTTTQSVPAPNPTNFSPTQPYATYLNATQAWQNSTGGAAK